MEAFGTRLFGKKLFAGSCSQYLSWWTTFFYISVLLDINLASLSSLG